MSLIWCVKRRCNNLNLLEHLPQRLSSILTRLPRIQSCVSDFGIDFCDNKLLMQHFILFAALRHVDSRTLQLHTTIQKALPQASSDNQALGGSLSGVDHIHALYACCKAIMVKFKDVEYVIEYRK